MRLFLVLAISAFTGFDAPAGAQSKGPPPLAKPDKPAAGSSAQAAPEMAVPSAESVVILIRSTLLNLNDAMRTGNFTVLRDLASPSFRNRNNAGRLYQIFAGLAAKRIDLSAAAIMVPELAKVPSIDADKRLHISGRFPDKRLRIDFELTFEAVAGQWRLFGIAVRQVQSASNIWGSETGAVPAAAAQAPRDEAVRK
jgi:hypothetical protein